MVLQGTILASVAITSVNGTEASASHWTVLAFWHGTLICSIFAVLIAFYLGVFIDMCETCMEGVPNLLQAIRHERGHAVNWIYMFALQSPVMIICYGIVSYIIGLFIFIIAPLWKTEWGNEDKVRTIIITTCWFSILKVPLDRNILLIVYLLRTFLFPDCLHNSLYQISSKRGRN